MINIKIDASDLESKIARLDIGAMRRAVGVAVAEEVRNVMGVYPPASRKKQPFVSPQQRKAFFAMLRRGQITVPYQRGTDPRSEAMGRKWQIVPTNDGAEAVNTASYSDLVMGARDKQARYHRGNWMDEETGARKVENSGVVEDIAGRVVGKALDDAGLS